MDKVKDVASDCGINAMPTFQLYKGGKQLDQIQGANKQALEILIQVVTIHVEI